MPVELPSWGDTPEVMRHVDASIFAHDPARLLTFAIAMAIIAAIALIIELIRLEP